MQPIHKSKDYATRVVIAVVASICVLGAFLWSLRMRLNHRLSLPKLSLLLQKKGKNHKPLEYKCAVINAGGFVAENDITVKRFRFLLDDLQKKTRLTK
jgi:hypothetical protein